MLVDADPTPPTGRSSRNSVTYKDLQERTGLSLATISKYFNGGALREPNRVAIEQAVSDLGYRVNTLARNMRTQRSRTVGVLLPALNNEFHLTIIAGVEATLWKHGISIVVSSSRGAEGRPGEAVDFLTSTMVDGIIAVPSNVDTAALVKAAQTGMPLVLVDRMIDALEVDGVVLDNGDAVRQAVQHLADHGHRRIAAISGPDDIWSMRDRNDGFRSAMAERGLDIEPRYLRSGPLTVASGEAAMKALLALPQRPTAVISLNYELTVGALITFNQSGLRMPEDLSFVGFDSLELAQVTKPRLSMLVQPVHQIARHAADLMLRQLDPDQTNTIERVTLAGELVTGASVARPNQ